MNICYALRFPDPYTHYTEVELTIKGYTDSTIQLKMPVWTPGSYLIREFARHIDFLEIKKGKQFERVQKSNKNTWTVDTNENEILVFRYRIYCFEWSVRTNFVDDEHAFLNGASTFLWIEGYENTAIEIQIEPHPDWKRIASPLALKDNNPWIRIAQHYDELADSPIEIGNHDSYTFDAGGISHEIALFGTSNADSTKLMDDLKSIVEEEVKIFGTHPCKQYLFIIHHSEKSFGGLEHSNSSVNHITRFHYEEKKYRHAISLLAHEYFHLWNVKRIRPAELIKYNYEAETYTRLLWFFEGITSYYDDLVCYRAGIFTRESYLEIVAENLNRVLNTQGIQVQTLAEASFDTWIKYYRQNENSNNAQISYYTKGGIVAMLLDFILMNATEGEHSLDDVMRSLFTDSQRENYTGITEKSLLQTFRAVSGIDFSGYFQQFIQRTDDLEVEQWMDLMGLILTDTTDPSKAWMGMQTQWRENKLFIVQVEKTYSAYIAGLNVNDEIISIDGVEVMADFEKIYAEKAPGDIVQFTISRQGIIKVIAVTLTADHRKKYTITVSEDVNRIQQKLLDKWLPG